MNDEKFWDKLEVLTERVQRIEIKIAGIEARMAVIVAFIGVAIQVSFKMLWP